jgi:hypothetical protein
MTLNSLLNLKRQATLQTGERRALPSPPPLLQLELVEICLLAVLCSSGIPLYDQLETATTTMGTGARGSDHQPYNYGLKWDRLSGLLVQEIQEWKDNKIITIASSALSMSVSSSSRFDEQQSLSFIQNQASIALARAIPYISSNSLYLIQATVALVTKLKDQCRQQHSMQTGPPSSQASEALWPFLEQQLQSWSMHSSAGPAVARTRQQQPGAAVVPAAFYNYASLSSSLSSAAALSSSNVASAGAGGIATLDANFCQAILDQVACMTRLRGIFQQHAMEQIKLLLTNTLEDERSAALFAYPPIHWGANRQEAAHLDVLLLQAQLLGVLRHGSAGTGGYYSDYVLVNNNNTQQSAAAESSWLMTSLRNAGMTKETIENRSLQLTSLLHLRLLQDGNRSSNNNNSSHDILNERKRKAAPTG